MPSVGTHRQVAAFARIRWPESSDYAGECHRVLCSLCVRRFYLSSDDYFRPRWRRFPLEYIEICSHCYEELEREKLEEESKIEEEQEPPEPITKCELCGANDEPPDRKIFGYSPPTFRNCDRCGKLVCVDAGLHLRKATTNTTWTVLSVTRLLVREMKKR